MQLLVEDERGYIDPDPPAVLLEIFPDVLAHFRQSLDVKVPRFHSEASADKRVWRASQVRDTALLLFRALGPQADAAMPDMLRLLHLDHDSGDEYGGARGMLIRALAAVGAANPARVIRVAKDAALGGERADALLALRRMKDSGARDEIVRGLLACLSDESLYNVELALDALEAQGALNAGLVKRLRARVKHEAPSVALEILEGRIANIEEVVREKRASTETER